MKPSRKAILRLTLLGAVFVAIGHRAFPQESSDSLEQGFKNPPSSAKPRVWWHWMNGNITKEGIKLDLEWMNRVGIGGFQNFDAALNTPQVVPKRLVYMTPEWKGAFSLRPNSPTNSVWKKPSRARPAGANRAAPG